MERNFRDLAWGLLIGILWTSYFIDNFFAIVLLPIFIFIVFNLFKESLVIKRLGRLSLFIIIGMAISFYNHSSSHILKYKNQEIILEAIVKSKNNNKKENINYIIKSSKLKFKDREFKVRENISLTIYGESKFKSGDILHIKAVPKEVGGNKNRKLFNYRHYLLSKKVHTKINVTLDKVQKKSEVLFPYKLREDFSNYINQRFIGLDQDNQKLVKGLILGNYRELDQEEQDNYRNLGLSHLLAVSGLHIGLISLIILEFFNIVKIHKKLSRYILILILWFYSFLIGFPVSIIRSNLMISFLLLSKNLYEPYDSLNALYCSMAILLLINPFNIYSLGFIFSYLASLSLIYGNNYIEMNFFIENKFVKNILLLLILSLAFLPIQLYFFNEIYIFKILANILLVPLFTFSLFFMLIIMVFFIRGFIYNYLIYSLNLILNIIYLIINKFNKLPLLKILIYSPNLSEIYIYYLLLILLYNLNKLKRVRSNIHSLACFTLAIYILNVSTFFISDKSLYLNFIDVGQGDSLLIRHRYKNILIDTGGETFGDYSIGENITLPYLIKNNITSLDKVFITHYHKDHYGALPVIIDKIKIKEFYFPYINEEEKFIRSLEKNQYKNLKLGDRIDLSKELSILIYNPKKISSNENNNSLVILLKYYDWKILLTGDIEKEIESNLLGYKNLENIDILKVAHHGSETSSTEEFLNHIRPRLGIISLGENNKFNHPSREVLERYESINTKIYRTDLNGEISIILGKNSMKVFPFLRESNIILNREIALILLSLVFLKEFSKIGGDRVEL